MEPVPKLYSPLELIGGSSCTLEQISPFSCGSSQERYSFVLDDEITGTKGKNRLGGLRSMGIFRLVAMLLLAVGLMLAGADIMGMLEGGDAAMRSVSGVWGTLHPGSLETLSAEGGPLAGSAGMVLDWPAFALTGGLGLVLAILFRAR